MPIRFRCQFCNQLMGISRRKAGMPVQCPNCRNQLIVPAEEGEAAPAAPAARGTAPAPLFERDDFDDFLKSGNSSAPARPAPPPLAPPPPAPYSPGPDVETPLPPQHQAPAPAGGIVVSPTLATVATVGLIILLAVAFGAGLLVGRFYLGGT